MGATWPPFSFVVMKKTILLLAVLVSVNAANANVLATQAGVSADIADMRAAMADYTASTELKLFPNPDAARDALRALLTTKLFAKNGPALLAANGDEAQFLNLNRDRRQLEAAIDLVERRARAAALAAPKELETRAREIYAGNPTGFKVPPRVTVAHILLRIENKSITEVARTAEEVMRLARTGTPWQTLVDAYSDDAKSKGEGGLVGDFYESGSDHPMVAAAFRSKIENNIAEPVVSRSGVHVVKILKREESRRASFDESKEKIIEAALGERIRMARETFLSKLRGNEEPVFNDAVIDQFVEKQDPAEKEKLEAIRRSVREGKVIAPSQAATPVKQ